MHRRSGSAKAAAAPAGNSQASSRTAAVAGSSTRYQLQQQPSVSTSGVSSSNSSNSNKSNSSSYNSSEKPGQGGKPPSSAVAARANGSEVTNGDSYFSSHAMNSLREAFKFFDIDQDGRITSAELQKVLKFLGTKVTEQEVKLMIADVDTDGNGTVEFNEFLKMMKKYYRQNAEEHSEDADMWEAFNAFDHNGDNFIDFAEIKKTMHFLGEEVSDEDVRSMIQEADVDNDGRINFEEFKKMMAVMQQKSNQS